MSSMCDFTSDDKQRTIVMNLVCVTCLISGYLVIFPSGVIFAL